MRHDTDKIDDATLALLYLTLHDHESAWKGHDWETLDRLHARGRIDHPADKAKSLAVADERLQRAKQLFEAMFVKRA